MSIWAGIKYAINSTLGTNDFKPLDKLLNDLVVEQSMIVASDDLYENFSSLKVTLPKTDGTTTTSASSVHPVKLKIKIYGTLRLKGDVARTSQASGYFHVYKNNEEVYTWRSLYSDSNTSESISVDISVEPGDLITFSLGGTNYSTRAGNVTIQNFAAYGTIKHAAYLKV